MSIEEQYSFINNYIDYNKYLSVREKVLKIPASKVQNFARFLSERGYDVPEMYLNE